jgi:hypothetical protein
MAWMSTIRQRAAIARVRFGSARVRYVLGVFSLFIFGGLGEYLGHVFIVNDSIGYTIILGLSEALLISGILALAVDPYLKKRIQDESGWNAVFTYLNPKAPKSLREEIQELTTFVRYHKKTLWSAHFEWLESAEKKILSVTLEARNTGIVLGSESYEPSGKPWVLASTSGHKSEYLRYALSCPDHFEWVDLAGPALQAYVVEQSDNSIYLDEAAVVAGRSVPSGCSYENTRKTRMYRQPVGYIPLHHGTFGENFQVELSGPALPDIEVTVAHPRREGLLKPDEWRVKSPDALPCRKEFGRVMPGHVTLVSWSPRVWNPQALVSVLVVSE